MSDFENKRLVTATGCAVIRKRPSYLLIVGSVAGNGNTLELALQNLDAKQAIVESWLKRLDACGIEFGESRLPEQREADPMSLARRRVKAAAQKTNKLLKGILAEPPAQDVRKADVFKTFLASWPLAGLSSREVLILSDRIRVEAGEAGDDEHEAEADSQRSYPETGFESVAAAVESLGYEENENRDTCFLFRTLLDLSDKERLTRQALADAKENAELIARLSGFSLGGLHSVREYTSISFRSEQAHDLLRGSAFPILKEVDLEKQYSAHLENPRAVEFTLSLSVSYEIA